MLLARYLCSFSSGKHRSMARHTEATKSPCLPCLFSVWVHHNDGLLGGALPGVDPTPWLAIPYSTHWSPGQCTLDQYKSKYTIQSIVCEASYHPVIWVIWVIWVVQSFGSFGSVQSSRSFGLFGSFESLLLMILVFLMHHGLVVPDPECLALGSADGCWW